MQELLGRILCFIGFHSFRVSEVTVGFGETGSVERVECRRCGFVTTRQGRA